MTEEQNLNRIIHCMRYGAFFILLLHLYYFLYPALEQAGLVHPKVDFVFLKIAKTGLFKSQLNSKLCALLLLAGSTLGTSGMKSENVSVKSVALSLLIGTGLYFGSYYILQLFLPVTILALLYTIVLLTGFILLIKGGNNLSRLISGDVSKDLFNEENETFPQEERYVGNEFSINIKTRYRFRRRLRNGWVNVPNPFRGTMVLGTPGSGKTRAVIYPYIMQHIEKGFAMYVYDYKFPDLTTLCYNALLQNMAQYPVPPKFYIINFDDLRRSHRCNPLFPSLMQDIVDAYQSAYTIMLNLNKSWIAKQGDFFVESPINFLTAAIWFLRIYENGRYCTFPHAIEFINRPYDEIFTIMASYPELENYIAPFSSAYEKGAMEQLEGQIASARIPLTRIASPQLYWVMTGNDFTLDINNPDEPKILCVGNNPDRQDVYGAALGLYNARLVKLVNKKNKLKSSLIIDELPTIYFKGLDTLVATARSNKVSPCLGFQDFSQLIRDYGEKEAKVIMNTIGNVFSGAVSGDTAKGLSERFGKIVQKRQSISYAKDSVNVSTSTQLDYMIPASKISNLTQGTFVGSVSDNIHEAIKLKTFHAQLLLDDMRESRILPRMKELPVIYNFTDDAGKDRLNEIIQHNFLQVKKDIRDICAKEMKRINPLIAEE